VKKVEQLLQQTVEFQEFVSDRAEDSHYAKNLCVVYVENISFSLDSVSIRLKEKFDDNYDAGRTFFETLTKEQLEMNEKEWRNHIKSLKK
jgi:hypothetical protein